MTGTLLPFLVSLLAAGHALIATGVWSLPMVALTLTLATAFTNPRSSEPTPLFRDAGFTRMVQLWAIYGLLLVIALVMMATRGHSEIVLAARGLVVLQVLALGLRGAGHSSLPVFINAQALICLVAMAGGSFAAIAITSYAVLTVLWMTIRHYELNRAGIGHGFRAALSYCLITLLVLGGWFSIAPPPRLGTVAFGDFAPELEQSLREAYTRLLLWAAGALLLLTFLRRVSKKKDPRPPTAVEEEEIEVTFDSIEPLDDTQWSDSFEASGARARLIEVYSGFLRGAAVSGRERSPSVTPLEFAATLPPPATSLAELFGKARYSSTNIEDDDVSTASSQAREVLAELRRTSGAAHDQR